jgi:hypothetical protein
MSNTLVTGEVRFSYINIFEPKQSNFGGDPKYSMVILIPKTDIATKQAIDKAIQETINENAQKVFGGATVGLHSPVHDGDGVMPDKGTPYSDECKGHWVLNCSSKVKPEVVDENLQPVMSQSQVYSGCYGRVSLRFFAYNQGKRGISAGLGNVQKLRDGDPLGGGTTAAQDFGGQAPYTQPAQTVYQQPTAQVPQPQQTQPVQAPYNQPTIDPATGQPYNFMGV